MNYDMWNACRHVDYEKMKRALTDAEGRVDPNGVMEAGETWLAILNKHTHTKFEFRDALKCAKLLLDQGADFRTGGSAINFLPHVIINDFKCKKEYCAYVKFLLEHGCPLPCKSKESFFWRFFEENGLNQKEVETWEKTGKRYCIEKDRATVKAKNKGLKDFLATKSERLEETSEKAKKSLKKQGLSGKALHDAEQKERVKVSKAILKQRQTTK